MSKATRPLVGQWRLQVLLQRCDCLRGATVYTLALRELPGEHETLYSLFGRIGCSARVAPSKPEGRSSAVLCLVVRVVVVAGGALDNAKRRLPGRATNPHSTQATVKYCLMRRGRVRACYVF